MGRIILTICLLFVTASFAEPPMNQQQQEAGQWVNEWWNTTYQKKIEPEQEQAAKEDTRTKCQKKVDYYNKMMIEDPKSSWYKWIHKKWVKRCKKETKSLR